MKSYEKKLFQHLQTERVDKKILSGLKNELGSIAFMKGNPLTKTEISLTIEKLYIGQIPAAAQTPIPVPLFGLTDFYSGYPKTNIVVPVNNGWVINGLFFGIVGFTANLAAMVAAGFGAFVRLGDFIILYADVVGVGFAYLCLLRIRCENIAYGTFLNSFVSDLITINTIRYFVPLANINQFINPIFFGTQSLFGKTKFDSIDPRMYITNKDPQQQISDIPIDLPIDKNLLCGFQMEFACNIINWTLFVEKVEPLTYKREKR